jgi:hypothetical protein
MFHTRLATAALLAALLPCSALAGKATTTRIETRPFYGATVTIEEGVRVFRPLPYHSNIIINPGGQTPLSLGFEQHRSYGGYYGAPSGYPVYGGYHGGYGEPNRLVGGPYPVPSHPAGAARHGPSKAPTGGPVLRRKPVTQHKPHHPPKPPHNPGKH